MMQPSETKLGLQENAGQFWLLVLVNGFVGAMVGLERSVIPEFAETVFGINGHTALLSFIVAFGLAKSGANLAMGRLASRYTRRQLLMIGWLFALPVPWLLLYAESWWWVIFANLLLGINQGLAWSATVVMKIDLVGEKNRGLAMGINEFAGYLAVGLVAFLAGYIASATGKVTYAFIPGIAFSLIGLLLTVFLVRDTHSHVQTEIKQTNIPLLRNIWKDTTWRHGNLGSVTLNGFVNNLNDGILWGLLPVLLSTKGYSLTQTGLLAGIYPVVWGLGQLVTGKFGDMLCKKQLLSLGMMLQGVAIALLLFAGSYLILITALALLGVGTALVYPNFLSVVAENTHPSQRPQSLGIFRFWRDFGYVAGAIVAGVFGDLFGLEAVILGTALLTIAAGLLSEYRMCCTKKLLWHSKECSTGLLRQA
ncbi:MFS transporter [Pontibacter sp. BT310]|uniref:MFS transporter n=1 Tax=Pontibacter populi TaxID=890055 RepID=A0ABS6XFP5_9BACT|nr:MULTISPECIES: MFS transporter [Pontibacter]MBJ6119606.1 MFS transporter [Pontibacter sp. BT310]MBR0572033.1 MFS transporter [Microvirga sp. STS03]MBW3366459.1 MFS transporter [Pontibacter populi]